jgi:hypothetical protein
VDDRGVIGQIELKEKGTLQFINIWMFAEIPEANNGFTIVPLSETKIFAGSTVHDSVVLDISQRTIVQISRTFPSVHSVKTCQKVATGFLCQTSDQIVELVRKMEFREKSTFIARGFERVFIRKSNGSFLISDSLRTVEVSQNGRIVEDSAFRDHATLFYAEFEDNWVHVTRENVVTSNRFELSGRFISCKANSELIVLATNERELIAIDWDGNEIRRMQLEDNVVSLALGAQYLAVGMAEISLFSLTDFALFRCLSFASRDLAFDRNGDLISIDARDRIWIHSMWSLSSVLVECPGIHFNLHPFLDGFIISGTRPTFVRDRSIATLDTEPFVYCSSDGFDIVYVTFDAIKQGTLLRNYENRIRPTDAFLTIECENGTRFHAQVSGGLVRWMGDSRDLFATYEQILSVRTDLNLVYVLCPSHLVTFNAQSKPVYVSDPVAVKNVVKLEVVNHLLYLVTDRTVIEFPSMDVVLVSRWPFNEIAMNSKFVVVLGLHSHLILFSSTESQSQWRFATQIDHIEGIAGVGILGDSIVCGTIECQLIIFTIVAGAFPGQWDVIRTDMFALGFVPRMMGSFDGCVALVLEDGEILEIKILNAIGEFEQVYDVLARKMKSLGGFSKRQQVATVQGRYLVRSQRVVALQIIEEFLCRPVREQELILAGSRFSQQKAVAVLSESLQSF